MSEPCDLSAFELRRLIGTKRLSPVELLDSCVRRIEAVNPTLNAIVNPCLERARSEAATAERNLSTTLRHRRFLFTDSFLLLWKWRVG